MEVGALGSMTRLAAMLLAWALALGCAQADAQAGATPPTPEHSEGASIGGARRIADFVGASAYRRRHLSGAAADR